MDAHLHHLAWFLVLAEEEHFGHAARRLSVTQPALSKALARLERDVGALLLERTSRAAVLTPAGRAFADAASTALTGLESGVLAARARADTSRRLRLGFLVGVPALTRLLAAAGSDPCRIAIELVGFPVSAVAAGLNDGTVDAAFTVPQQDVDDLGFVCLWRDARMLLVPEHHPWAGRRRIEMDELPELDGSDTWLLPQPAPCGSNAFRRFWGAGHLRGGRLPPRCASIVSNEDLALQVAAGRGVGFVFRSFVLRYTIPGVVALTVGHLPPGEMGLCWRRETAGPVVGELAAVAAALGALHGTQP